MGFFYSGGGERVAIQQALGLRRRGHEVKVYSPIIYADKSFPDQLRQVGPERLVPHLPFPFPFRESSAMLASAVFPFGIMKVADCDVMLCHSQPSMWLGLRLNSLHGVPYVGYLHQLTTFIHPRPAIGEDWNTGDFQLLDGIVGGIGKPIARSLDRLCHARASRLLFNSEWTKRLFAEAYGLGGETVYPGIASHGPVAPGERKGQVVTAARHYPWKRIDLTFEVLAKMKQKSLKLVVTSKETPYTAVLKRRVRLLGLEDRVTFTGFVPDDALARIMTESKGYVQTSIQEPFGLSPVEAQSYGLPAVVWGDAGMRETVIDGETGFLAKPYDTQDFAEKLDAIVSDPPLWSRMSREAENWSQRFGWESHLDKLEAALAEAKR
jgi:glycosyltransferase involved in cell wall biosynthesis